MGRRINWGASSFLERGVVIGAPFDAAVRTAIGSHNGIFSAYRALGVASGKIIPTQRSTPSGFLFPHFKDNESWRSPDSIVSLDPWGYSIVQVGTTSSFPTIACTQARLSIPEISQMVLNGFPEPDGKILLNDLSINVTKIAVSPVWYLPGIAKRLNIEEGQLRETLYHAMGEAYPQLLAKNSFDIFLPPIDGATIYLFGDHEKIKNPKTEICSRLHDQCHGSDVFGSDVCTCRPYLIFSIATALEVAQKGGVGVIIYTKKEGRNFGEVQKFQIYNERKKSPLSDTPERYFSCSEQVTGGRDLRFQELSTDYYKWLGIKRIDKFVSMSQEKLSALKNSGIEVMQQIEIPVNFIPPDAKVEIAAKIQSGYYATRDILLDAHPIGRRYKY